MRSYWPYRTIQEWWSRRACLYESAFRLKIFYKIVPWTHGNKRCLKRAKHLGDLNNGINHPFNFYVVETENSTDPQKDKAQATQATQRKSPNNFRVFRLIILKWESGRPFHTTTFQTAHTKQQPIPHKQQTAHSQQTTPQNDFRIFRWIILKCAGWGGSGGSYDAKVKCIVGDYSTSSQWEAIF